MDGARHQDDDGNGEDGRDERHGPPEQDKRDRGEQTDPRTDHAERTGPDRFPVDGANRKPGQEPGRGADGAEGFSHRMGWRPAHRGQPRGGWLQGAPAGPR